MNVIPLPPELENAIIFCEDCQEEIMSLMDHLQTYPLTADLYLSLGKQFEGHVEHNVCILSPQEEDDFASYVLGRQGIEKNINTLPMSPNHFVKLETGKRRK